MQRTSLHRRIGFWLLGEVDAGAIIQVVARLVSEAVLVTDVRVTRDGWRSHVVITLARIGSPEVTAVLPGGHTRRFRVHPRQRRAAVAALPSLLVWRLCKDRRWHYKHTPIETPISALDW